MIDVIVVGGGPAGLRAAAELAPSCEVVVLEREAEAGGIPRHSHHTGFGIRDLRRFVSGPRYAALLRDAAVRAGATIRTSAMATGWASGPAALEVTSPDGREVLTARAVVLATGARERPRTARLVPGDRPAGVYTTGHLQNLVHHGVTGGIGRRAVVVGAEAVAWSAVLTLRHAGCRTALVTTAHTRPDAYWFFQLPARAALRIPLLTGTRLVAVHGRPRVVAVELEDVGTGARRTVECDTVVLSGDWYPDNELFRSAGLPLDSASGSPLVDTALRTARPGLFAAGNALHPVDTADVAALDGLAVAASVRAFLAGAVPPPVDAIRLLAAPPFRWVAPQLFRPGDPAPPRGRLLLWPEEYVRAPVVAVRQGGRVLARRRVWWPAAPGRVFHLPADVLEGLPATTGEPLTIGLA